MFLAIYRAPQPYPRPTGRSTGRAGARRGACAVVELPGLCVAEIAPRGLAAGTGSRGGDAGPRRLSRVVGGGLSWLCACTRGAQPRRRIAYFSLSLLAIIMMTAMSEGTFVARDNWIGRRLELERLLARRSVFLFGPRQTGKTTYVRRQLGDTVELTFTLLDQGLLTSVLADPTRIRREVEARGPARHRGVHRRNPEVPGADRRGATDDRDARHTVPAYRIERARPAPQGGQPARRARQRPRHAPVLVVRTAGGRTILAAPRHQPRPSAAPLPVRRPGRGNWPPTWTAT